MPTKKTTPGHVRPKFDEDDLLRRALDTYFREAKAKGLEYYQPNSGASCIEDYGGAPCYVLRNGRGPLACFGIGPTGRLRRLAAEHWPAQLTAEDEGR